jgi:hypothetical protein
MVTDGTNGLGKKLLRRDGPNVPSQIEAVRTASGGMAALVCDPFDVGDIARGGARPSGVSGAGRLAVVSKSMTIFTFIIQKIDR